MTEQKPKRVQHSNSPQTALDRVQGYALVLQREWPEMERRFKAWRRDGYPTGTLGGGRGNGAAITVQDENGDPDRVPVTSVESAYFTEDDVAQMDLEFRTQLAEWLGIGVRLWRIREDIMGEPVREARKKQNTLAACANQYTCPDEAWAEKAGRCDSCYRYLRRTGRDRTGRYPQQEQAVIEEAS